ncbi:hypothetical protein G6F66_009062 [Rhizopus arrhizus]|nr:hypothetical protein G6F66_009062 [Rhizopus arrhizus]
MLAASLKRFRTNSVQPYSSQDQREKKNSRKLKLAVSSSSNQLAGFLQKKVTSMQAKKLIKQFRDLDLKIKRQPSFSTTSTVLFDSDELLPSTKSPLSSPKKSQTMPSFTTFDKVDNKQCNELTTRTLPRLPSEVSITLSANSSSNHTNATMKEGLTRASTWVGKSIRNLLKPVSSEQTISSTENDGYLLFDEDKTYIQGNPKTLSSENPYKKMTLHCKILQITNLSSSKTFPYTLSMQVTNNETQTYSGVMKRVARGVSTSNPHATLSFAIQGKFTLDCSLNIHAVSSLSLVGRLKQLGRSNSTSSNSTVSTLENAVDAHLQLNSGENPLSSFANKGIGQYAIQTSPLQNPSLALELTLSFWLEDNDESKGFESQIERDVLMFCQGGDYLTFYVKGDSYPTWVRYWVTYEKNQLLLRLNERRGAPVESISIENLTGINTCPSDDIQEEIYLGKKYGIILSFGASSVMYLFADSSKSVRYWQSLLEVLTSNADNSQHQISKRYIWTI